MYVCMYVCIRHLRREVKECQLSRNLGGAASIERIRPEISTRLLPVNYHSGTLVQAQGPG